MRSSLKLNCLQKKTGSLASGAGLNTLSAPKNTAVYSGGYVTVRIAGTVEIKFPSGLNPRLARGTDAQLKNIEVSPFGLHWPDLDEALCFKGLLKGEL